MVSSLGFLQRRAGPPQTDICHAQSLTSLFGTSRRTSPRSATQHAEVLIFFRSSSLYASFYGLFVLIVRIDSAPTTFSRGNNNPPDFKWVSTFAHGRTFQQSPRFRHAVFDKDSLLKCVTRPSSDA